MAFFCIKTDPAGTRGKERNRIVLKVTGQNITAVYLLTFRHTNLTERKTPAAQRKI
jgi:hypothetical protein